MDSLWLYNKQTPGPVIEANENDIIRVEFVNNLDEPSTIHWHGIKNINKMDGVPYLTQEPVQPGETYIYEFPVKNAGTFWYHAHFQTWKQISKGLYGPLIVKNHLDEQMHSTPIHVLDYVIAFSFQSLARTCSNDRSACAECVRRSRASPSSD